MPLFHYTARNKQGTKLTGEMQAGSCQEIAQQLNKNGITPIEINWVKKAQSKAFMSWRGGLETPKPTELITFSYQMFTLMKAGVPINRALRSLEKSAHNPSLLMILSNIIKCLEMGKTLSTALSLQPTVFSNFFVNIIRIGENTGSLDESFLRIAKYLELEKNTREQIKAALRYPIIVIIGISIAIVVASVVVIPKFAAIFAQAKVDLPLQTRIILAISDFMVASWPILLIGSLIIGVAIRFWLHTQRGRYQWDKFKLRLPIIGSIITRALLGRYARVFSVTLTSGIPLIQALTDAAQAVDNTYMSTFILQMRHGIERGETLTRTAQASGLFTPLILQMIEVGEETGKIDSLLLQVAEVYEREVDYATKNLSVLIEPILLVIIGIMVLILALGVFLPMWDLVSVYK